MRLGLRCSAFVPLLLVAASAFAQDGPPATEPTAEHKWLARFVGEWTSTGKTEQGPDTPVMECTGTISSRLLGELWVVNEIDGEMPGVNFKAIQTIGYDAKSKKFVGTWIDTMTDHLWRYEGRLDEKGEKLMLEATGPSMMPGGGETLYRDSYEFTASGTIVSTSEVQGPNGEWVTFMTGELKRVGK